MARMLDFADEEPDYGEALARYFEANPDAPDAARFRALSAPARPADTAGIRVRPAAALAEMAQGAAPNPSPEQAQAARSAEIQAAAARGEDLSRFETPIGPGARPPPTRIEPTERGEAMLADLQDAAAAQKPGLLSRLTAPLPAMLGGTAVLPLPDVEMPLPTMPEPAERPVLPKEKTVQLGKVAEVETPRTAVVQSMDRGPSPAAPPPQATAQIAQPPAPSKPDPLELALEQARNNRLIATLTRAGGTAIGRGRGPGYDALDANADRPLQELGLRQQRDARAKAEAAAALDADPNSPQSQMARELVAGLSPQFAQSPMFARASYAQLSSGPLGKFLSEHADLQRARIAADAEVEKERIKRRGVVGGAAKKDVQGLAKDLEDLPQVRADLATLRAAANASGDVPGLGWFDSRKPAFMQSGEDTRVRQAANRVLNARLHALGGANVTPQEFERIARAYGLGPGATEAESRTGIESLLSDTDADLRAKIAKYGGAEGAAPRQLAAQGFDLSPVSASTAGAGGPTAKDAAALQWLQANPTHKQAAKVRQALMNKGLL